MSFFPPDEPGAVPSDVQFLISNREMVLDGKSIYGAADSHRAKERLAEIDARLGLAEREGRYTPPQPWTPDRVASEALAQEYPRTPSLELSDDHAAFYSAQMDRLDELPPAQIAKMTDDVAGDLADRVSLASAPYSAFDRETGARKSGHEILRAMLADAETVVRANIENPAEAAEYLKLLAADRPLLENFCLRAQHVAKYAARRSALGISA